MYHNKGTNDSLINVLYGVRKSGLDVNSSSFEIFRCVRTVLCLLAKQSKGEKTLEGGTLQLKLENRESTPLDSPL